MKCSVDKCGGVAGSGNLCAKCNDLRDSAVIVGACLGLCAFIIAMARLGRML